MKSLNQSTNNLYNVFSKYILKAGLRDRSCECCVSDEEIRDVVDKPLRVLDEKCLGHYLGSAVSTFGDVEDLKYFLPRILELMRLNEIDIIYEFLTFEKLDYSSWKTWDTIEVESIENYFLALLEQVLSNEDADTPRIEEVLSLASKYLGLSRVITVWEENYSKNSIRVIVDFVLDNRTSRFFADQKDEFLSWASAPKILQRIQDLYFETEDELEASRISVAYTILEKTED